MSKRVLKMWMRFGAFLGLALASGGSLAESARAELLSSFYRKQELSLVEEHFRHSPSAGLQEEALFHKLARDYEALREVRSERGSGPRRHEAQYLDALLLAKFPTIYDLLFESQKKKAYESEVVGIKLSTLFDAFMEMVAEGQVPEAMKSAADEVGECVAKVIVRAKAGCELDDHTTHEPSMAKLAWVRMTCGALTSDCGVRRDFFAAAKPKLEEARRDPKVRKQIEDKFEAIFPEKFRQGLLVELSKMRASYSQWVAAKFLPEGVDPAKVGQPSLLLGFDSSLFIADERSERGAPIHRLDGLAHGLRLDLALARLGKRVVRAHPDSSQIQSVAAETAAAFWASIQQMLVLTGGARAAYNGMEYELIEGSQKELPPRFSKESPYLRGEIFGGLGVSKLDSSFAFQTWDWENYVNLPGEKGTFVQFLPHRFRMDRAGRPQAVASGSDQHSMGDQAALLEALNDFLETTEVGGELAAHFGPQESLADLPDPSKPILLPSESRLLGYAMLAGVFRNLTHPDHSLVEKQEKILPGEGLGVKFFESASLGSPERPHANTTSLSRLILASARLRNRVLHDPQFPGKDRNAVVYQLDTLIQIGALSVIAQAQNKDGGFRQVLNSPPEHSDLMSSILALRAIQTAYSISGMKIYTINLKTGMRWMKANLPSLSDSDLMTAERRVAMWHFLRMWDASGPDWSEAIFGPEGKELRNQWEKRLLETLN